MLPKQFRTQSQPASSDLPQLLNSSIISSNYILMQIEHYNPFTQPTRSVFDRLPLVGGMRERRRVNRGEDDLSLLVINKLMGYLETNGFTVTYVMNRKLYAGNSVSGMEYITDTSNVTQEQKVILKGRDGKPYRVKLRSEQSREGSQVSRNDLSLSIKDNIEKGPQRFVAIYKTQAKPGFWRQTHEEHAGKHFYGIHAKNWRFYRSFDLEGEVYPVFLKEILDSSVDVDATQEDYDRFELERKTQSTPRSTVMTSVVWNSRPEGLLS